MADAAASTEADFRLGEDIAGVIVVGDEEASHPIKMCMLKKDSWFIHYTLSHIPHCMILEGTGRTRRSAWPGQRGRFCRYEGVGRENGSDHSCIL